MVRRYLHNFSGTHSGSHADSETSTSTTTTTYYHDESYSSGEALLEAGVFTAPALVFFYNPTDPSRRKVGRDVRQHHPLLVLRG